MGSKTRAREIMAEAGVPIVPGATEPAADVDGGEAAGRGSRLPGRLQGGGRRRRQGLPRRDDARRPRGGLRGRRPRRREVLLRRARLRRALPRGPAPRRGPGAGRLARQRDPPRRARLLDPAPPPEGDRGGARPARRRRDARADRQDRHRRGRRGRLPRRRHGRGDAGRRGVLLPRDEHAGPGRALRDRDGHRGRHRPRAGPGSPPARSSRSPRRRSSCAATRSSAGSTPRPPTRSSRRRRGRSRPTASRRARACGSTRGSRPAPR